jgi:hypothetical protein
MDTGLNSRHPHSSRSPSLNKASDRAALVERVAGGGVDERVTKMNYDGLAELGWRGSQWVNGKNGYAHWEKLTPAEQADLKKDLCGTVAGGKGVLA